VQDGILTNASFMYRVHRFWEDRDADTYTATDWEVYEISLVTVPADASVGVGRALATEEAGVNQSGKESGMDTQVMDRENDGASTGGIAPSVAAASARRSCRRDCAGH
jgi:phage head maturation protease